MAAPTMALAVPKRARQRRSLSLACLLIAGAMIGVSTSLAKLADAVGLLSLACLLIAGAMIGVSTSLAKLADAVGLMQGLAISAALMPPASPSSLTAAAIPTGRKNRHEAPRYTHDRNLVAAKSSPGHACCRATSTKACA